MTQRVRYFQKKVFFHPIKMFFPPRRYHVRNGRGRGPSWFLEMRGVHYTNISLETRDTKGLWRRLNMNIQELPEEVLLTLFEYLHFRDLRDLEMVSRFFNSFIFKQNVYRKKYLKLPEYDHKLYFDDWLENNPYFNVRKMVTEFYKKRLYDYQFLEGRQIRGLFAVFPLIEIIF